jgi:transposase
MAPSFIAVDRDQGWLMPPSVRDWLPEGHLALFVLDVVAGLDLSALVACYRADGSSRPAHDPRMMVALLLYAYAVGELSSRRIERRCVEDVAFRVIAANQVPDHTTIARFRARHARALAGLFTQVLALCAKAGMVKVGVVALDGTKLRANASLGQTRRYESIKREMERMLQEAGEIDAAEDEVFGEARGDELPEELADPVTRRERLQRAARELEREHQAEARAFEAAHAAKVERREEHRERTGRYPRGCPPGPEPRKPARSLEERRINVTDPDSRIVSARGAALQGYNPQAVVGEGLVIIAAGVTASPNDSNQLRPMLAAARENLGRIGHRESIKCALADGGYWHHDEIAAEASRAVVIVPTSDSERTERKRAPRQGPQAERINRILATPAGRKLYRRRAELVEPVFAHTKHIRGIRAFSRRGLDAVSAEWQLIATTHNLLKLFRQQPALA